VKYKMLSGKNRKIVELFVKADTMDFPGKMQVNMPGREELILEIIEKHLGDNHLELSSYSVTGLCNRRLFISGAPLSQGKKLSIGLCTCGETINLTKNGKSRTYNWRTGKRVKACNFIPLS